MSKSGPDLFVYLAYFDDSGSDNNSSICVFGGVVVPGDDFGHTEEWSHRVIENLGLNDSFEEFKAHDLYYGHNAFKSIDKAKCRESFLILLSNLTVGKYPFIYSAIDKKQLQAIPLFGSSHPVDIAFQMCLDQLELWARGQHEQYKEAIFVDHKDMCLIIADECDVGLRKQLQATFRQKRTKLPLRPGDNVSRRLFHVHDSMYFGDSRDSVGLQIADVANWSMRRYLGGEELDEKIIDQLKKVSICASVEPQWSERRNIFKSHLDITHQTNKAETR